ncbi:MAG: ATP-binding cassette domain-containing protein, partial [Thermoleophilia bacterium]|nr:ATP-binding cassette domain-containing protein [Thermoleophilia bacterium]
MPATSADRVAIAVRDLAVVRGGKRVLGGISLDVPRGRISGLLGPSGCGKTTLMRAIVGVQVVAGGSIEVLEEPAGSAGLRSRVGYLTQAPSVYGDLSVAENLRYFGALFGVGEERIAATIETVGLGGDEGRIT